MISQILRDSFELYRRFAARFIATAAVVFFVMDLLAALSNSASLRGGFISAAFWGLLSFLFWIVGFFWVQGALVEAVQDVRDGRIDFSIRQLFERASIRLPSLIATGLLAGLGIAVGLFFLLLPGLFLLTRWIVIIPVVVIEKASAGETFGRSSRLVRGSGWDVFGLLLITFLLTAVAQGILVGLFAWLPAFFATWFGNFMAHSVVSPFVVIAWTLLYHRLVAERAAEPRLPVGPPPTQRPPTLQPPTPTAS